MVPLVASKRKQVRNLPKTLSKNPRTSRTGKMGLAGRKIKQRIGVDPRNKSWADGILLLYLNHQNRADIEQMLPSSGNPRAHHSTSNSSPTPRITWSWSSRMTTSAMLSSVPVRFLAAYIRTSRSTISVGLMSHEYALDPPLRM